MYLSQLKIDPRGSDARRDIADAYEMHRTLSRAFVEDDVSKPSRFGWRVEFSGMGNAMVLINSEIEPDWTYLKNSPGYLAQDPQVRQWNPSQKISEEQILRFKIVANPVVKREGKRLGLFSEEDQIAWLDRKAKAHGFSIASVLVTDSGMSKMKKGDRPISLFKVQFEGVLKVVDKNLFIDTIASGIGHGKAFGCGLLSIG